MRRLLATLLLLAPLTACAVVDSTEHCVETRYGDVVRPYVPPGLTGVLTVDLTCFPVTDMNYPLAQGETEQFEAQTSDPVTITGQISAVYSYRDIPALFKDKRTPDNAQVQALNALREALGVATQQRTIAELFGPGRATFGDSVKAIAQRKAGAHIVFKQVFVNNLHAPQAIEAARIAAARKETELNQALKQLQIDSATATGARIKADAAAYAKQKEAEAMAASPEVLKLRVTEAMANGLARACAGASTCILGGNVIDKWMAGVPK